jgi:hypothetical protein
MLGPSAFEVRWPMPNAAELVLVANLGAAGLAIPAEHDARLLWANGQPGAPCSVSWSIVSRAA